MRKNLVVLALTAVVTAGILPMNTQAATRAYVVGSNCNLSALSNLSCLPNLSGNCLSEAELSKICGAVNVNLQQLQQLLNDNCNTPTVEKPEQQKPEQQKPEQEKPGTETEVTQSAYAQKVVELVNAERAKYGLKALTVDTAVTAAANIRAEEIKTSFSHTRPNGSKFSTVLTANGITFRGAGENIAWGQKTPEEVMRGWMNSEGHRANILNAKYTTIGVGYQKNANGTNYWTQLFTH